MIDACAAVCAEHGKQLIVGAGTNSTAKTVAAVEALAGTPALTATLIVVPYYVRPSEAGVVAHFQAVADASPVPVVVYNIPIRTGRNLGPAGMLELARHANIVGVKQAVGALDADTLEILAGAPRDFSVLGGDDPFLLPTVLMGGAGAICASAHLCTERFVAMIECGLAAKVDDGRAHAEALLPVVQACFAEPNPAVFKGVLHAQGRIPTPDVRLPLVRGVGRSGRRGRGGGHRGSIESARFRSVSPREHALSMSERAQERAYERRWWILVVLCFSLLVIVLDNTILNVAIPTIVRDLDATNSQLQWMVDAYTLVFAGLLLTAGSLGDRFGRRGALQFGLVVFGLGSLASAFADSSTQLIATRAFMGIGGAFIMPATLSIITNVFPTRERGKAIGVWAGTAGLARRARPAHRWVPARALLLGLDLPGEHPDRHRRGARRDLPHPRRRRTRRRRGSIPSARCSRSSGSRCCSTASSRRRRTAGPIPASSGASVGGILVLGLFMLWESRIDHPMLDVHFFRNPRFTAASLGIAMVFFAMFGATFLLTQYFQFVLGYTPFETGIRFLPIAASMMILSPLSARFVQRIGTKLVVGTGLTMVTAGLVSWASLEPDEPVLARHHLAPGAAWPAAWRSRWRRRPSRSWDRSRSGRPGSARRSTTRPARSAARSGSP